VLAHTELRPPPGMRCTGMLRSDSQRRAVRSVQLRKCPIAFQPMRRRPPVPPVAPVTPGPAPVPPDFPSTKSRLAVCANVDPPFRLPGYRTCMRGPLADTLRSFGAGLLGRLILAVLGYGGARGRAQRSRARARDRCGRRGRTREGSGRRRAIARGAGGVLCGYSHRSRMRQVGHFGARAVHT